MIQGLPAPLSSPNELLAVFLRMSELLAAADPAGGG
jgi:hypothetical protein